MFFQSLRMFTQSIHCSSVVKTGMCVCTYSRLCMLHYKKEMNAVCLCAVTVYWAHKLTTAKGCCTPRHQCCLGSFFPLFNSFIMSYYNFVFSCQWQIENANEWACKYLNGPHIVIAYILSIYLPEMTRGETLLIRVQHTACNHVRISRIPAIEMNNSTHKTNHTIRTNRTNGVFFLCLHQYEGNMIGLCTFRLTNRSALIHVWNMTDSEKTHWFVKTVIKGTIFFRSENNIVPFFNCYL